MTNPEDNFLNTNFENIDLMDINLLRTQLITLDEEIKLVADIEKSLLPKIKAKLENLSKDLDKISLRKDLSEEQKTWLKEAQAILINLKIDIHEYQNDNYNNEKRKFESEYLKTKEFLEKGDFEGLVTEMIPRFYSGKTVPFNHEDSFNNSEMEALKPLMLSFSKRELEIIFKYLGGDLIKGSEGFEINLKLLKKALTLLQDKALKKAFLSIGKHNQLEFLLEKPEHMVFVHQRLKHSHDDFFEKVYKFGLEKLLYDKKLLSILIENNELLRNSKIDKASLINILNKKYQNNPVWKKLESDSPVLIEDLIQAEIKKAQSNSKMLDFSRNKKNDGLQFGYNSSNYDETEKKFLEINRIIRILSDDKGNIINIGIVPERIKRSYDSNLSYQEKEKLDSRGMGVLIKNKSEIQEYFLRLLKKGGIKNLNDITQNPEVVKDLINKAKKITKTILKVVEMNMSYSLSSTILSPNLFNIGINGYSKRFGIIFDVQSGNIMRISPRLKLFFVENNIINLTQFLKQKRQVIGFVSKLKSDDKKKAKKNEIEHKKPGKNAEIPVNEFNVKQKDLKLNLNYFYNEETEKSSLNAFTLKVKKKFNLRFKFKDINSRKIDWEKTKSSGYSYVSLNYEGKEKSQYLSKTISKNLLIFCRDTLKIQIMDDLLQHSDEIKLWAEKALSEYDTEKQVWENSPVYKTKLAKLQKEEVKRIEENKLSKEQQNKALDYIFKEIRGMNRYLQRGDLFLKKVNEPYGYGSFFYRYPESFEFNVDIVLRMIGAEEEKLPGKVLLIGKNGEFSSVRFDNQEFNSVRDFLRYAVKYRGIIQQRAFIKKTIRHDYDELQEIFSEDFIKNKITPALKIGPNSYVKFLIDIFSGKNPEIFLNAKQKNKLADYFWSEINFSGSVIGKVITPINLKIIIENTDIQDIISSTSKLNTIKKYFDNLEIIIDRITYKAVESSIKKHTRTFWKNLKENLLPMKVIELMNQNESLADILVENAGIDFWESLDNNSVPKEVKITKKQFRVASNLYPLRAAKYLEDNWGKLNEEQKEAISDGVLNFAKNLTPSQPSQYLDLMRLINHAHNWESTKRKAIIDNLKGDDLYWLAVHGREEVFTSTSSYRNYIYPKLKTIFQSEYDSNFYKFLSQVDPKHEGLPMFLEVMSRFGLLDIFINQKNTEDSKNSMRSVAKSLIASLTNKEKHYGRAISVLEILKELHKNVTKNKEFIIILGDELEKSYKTKKEGSKEQKVVGVIASIYTSFYLVKGDFFLNMKEKYKITRPEKLEEDQLFDRDEKGKKIHRQVWYFYKGNDDDGKISRQTAIGQLKSRGFRESYKKSKEENIKNYTILTYSRNGRTAEIYIYHLLDEDDFSIPPIKELKGKKVHGIIHGGHSTYVPASEKNIRNSKYDKSAVAFMFLRSCGGFSNISTLAKAIGHVPHPYSTHGTGSTDINDQALPLLAKTIVDDGRIVHRKLWKKVGNQKFPGRNYKVRDIKNFDSYAPPNESFAAMFLASIE